MTGALNLFDDNRVRLTDEQAMDELRDDIMRASFRRGTVRLDSGVEQPYYFDKYLITARPAILRRIARFLADGVPAGTDRLAAPALGAIAIGAALSLQTGLPLAVVRTGVSGAPEPAAPDGTGPERARRAVEGGLYSDESVVLIEDVVVTGSRAARGIDLLRTEGAAVSTVLAVIDCERGAPDRLHAEGVEYRPLYRYSTLARVGEAAS